MLCRSQIRAGKVTFANPANGLNAIVAGDDPVTKREIFHPALAIWCGNQRTRCKAGHDDVFDFKEIGRAGNSTRGVQEGNGPVLRIGAVIFNFQ